MKRPDVIGEGPAPGFESDALALARALFERDGELARLALIESPVGRMCTAVPVPPPTNPAAGDMVMAVFRAVLARVGAVGVAMLSEAWVAACDKDTPRSALPADLSDYDQRREQVVVIVEHHEIEGGLPRLWHAEIARDEGRPTLGAFVRQDLGARVSGRMIGVLPSRKGGPQA